MPVSTARAEFIKTGFKTVDSGPDAGVETKYGKSARTTSDPVQTFFESEDDAQVMCDDRMALLSEDRRRFNHIISGEETGLALVYNQNAPQCTVLDTERGANHPAIVAEMTVDFGSQTTSLVTWGGN